MNNHFMDYIVRFKWYRDILERFMLLSSISIDIYISVYFRSACSWVISFHICTKTFLTSDLAQQKSFKVVRNKENV